MLVFTQNLFRLTLILVLCSTLVGCASSAPSPNVVVSSSPVEEPPRDSELVEIPMVVTPTLKRYVEPGTRIVVAAVDGRSCGEEVKDALMRRLIDNTNYIVLSRDNLRYLMNEVEQGWGGRFNSRKVAEIGELWGASLFVFGRVAYCGPSSYDLYGERQGNDFSIFATLHIVDVQTGEVVVSSSAEGKYVPRPAPYSFAADEIETGGTSAEEPKSGFQTWAEKQNWTEMGLRALRTGLATGDWEEGLLSGALGNSGSSYRGNQELRLLDGITSHLTDAGAMGRAGNLVAPEPGQQTKDAEKKRDEFIRIRAAEDLANSFADKFFARPTWEKVEMWHNSRWEFAEAIRFVKLGYCRKAVDLMQEVGSENMELMTERHIAEYLHNHGVALLCANQPKIAAEKFRAAYRVGLELSTLKMLGLASRLAEWSMNVERNDEPALEHLVARDDQTRSGQSLAFASSPPSVVSDSGAEDEK